MRVISWNVNGLRACAKKGFGEFLDRSGADIVGIQELRALPEQLPEDIRSPPGWHTVFVPAERKGYSGVAFFSRHKPDKIETSLGIPELDAEGRFVMIRVGKLALINGYFPKGSGKDRDNSRVEYKLEFYRAVFERMQRLRRRYPTLVMGDYNTAHTAIDLARPKTNTKSSGFLPEEREEIDRWIEAGWTDTFRHTHPEQEGHYTWWRQWGGARENNVGWRIDYVMGSPSAMKRMSDAFIWTNEMASDHCPVGVDIDMS
jgi:exodeoxyribonuclease-3